MKKTIYRIKTKGLRKLQGILNHLLKGNRSYNRYVFSNIYKKDIFNYSSLNKDSKSGPGSNLEQTKEIIIKIPQMLEKFNIRSILDVPCGDFFWMSQINLKGINYTGGDIVPDIIKNNHIRFSKAGIAFKTTDIINDSLPEVDLIICRDLFVHLKNDQITSALRNIKKSGSKYLLTTSFRDLKTNMENHTIGGWRPINLEILPFKLENPADAIFENCTEAGGKFNDKYLLLYRIENL